MHEGKEAEESIIIRVEVTVLVRFVLRIPELGDKLPALFVRTHQRGGGGSGYQTQRVAQCFVSSGAEGIFHLCAIHIVLVCESIDALGVEEVLDAVAVGLLSVAVGTSPGVI